MCDQVNHARSTGIELTLVSIIQGVASPFFNGIMPARRLALGAFTRRLLIA
jgi:hypothetical protein